MAQKSVSLRPMLQVHDVEASSRRYQQMLGLRSGHGGSEYEMLFAGEDFLLHLHGLDAHEHGILQAGADEKRGIGVSLWFQLEDEPALRSTFERAAAAGADVAEPPHWNPLAHHFEASLRDPDGFVVVIHSPFSPDSAPST